MLATLSVRSVLLCLILLPALSGCVSIDPESGASPSPATSTPDSDTSPEAAPSATQAPSPTPAAVGIVTLNAVGDIMLERDLITLMDQHGSIYPFAAVQELLDDADLTIGNIEGTFTDGGVRANKFYAFRTPTRHAAGLAQAGFDIVSLGNNHAMDYGAQGLADTVAALDEAGVLHSGAGLNMEAARRPTILEANGLRIAFLSYNAAALSEAYPAGPATPGVALAEVASIQQDVTAARADADVVVVSLHAGTEYTDQPTNEQVMLSRTAIDAGAAVVLGHHPHVLQGWEHYGDGYIFYSLGNFVFDLDFEDLETLGARPFQSVILRLELTAVGVESVEMRPVFIDPAENRPLPAKGERLHEIEARLELLNMALN